MSDKKVSIKEIRLLADKKTNGAKKLRGKRLFKASARLLLEYLDWIKPELDPNDDNELDVTLQQEKKTEQSNLTLQDRSVLLIEPNLRTKKEKLYIFELLKTLKAFKNYSDDIKMKLAEVCCYQFFGSNRQIVKQNHSALNLYYIISGEVEMTQILVDDISEVRRRTLGPGGIFGEIELLHNIPRPSTVTSKTPVDLIYIKKSDFDEFLKSTLVKNWDTLKDALSSFDYFKFLDETAIRECCDISQIKDFPADEILLGDGFGMVNYVYFLLSGKCRLIEHMLIKKEKSKYGEIKYKLYEEKNNIRKLNEQIKNINDSYQQDKTSEQPEHLKSSSVKEKLPSPTKKLNNEIDVERMSFIKSSLLDIVNMWHEMSEIALELLRQPSPYVHHIPGVETIFMQICEFTSGACFGLGENMRNRRIVSSTPVQCLLIPRHWLMKHNRANIWERVKIFLNLKYPKKKELFNQFLMNKRWMKYQKKLMDDIIQKNKKVYNNTTIYDVPLSIRINSITD